MGREHLTTELRMALSGWQRSVAVQLVRRVQEGAVTANMHVESRKKMNPKVLMSGEQGLQLLWIAAHVAQQRAALICREVCSQ